MGNAGPVMHVQTWASYSALYRFGRLSEKCFALKERCCELKSDAAISV